MLTISPCEQARAGTAGPRRPAWSSPGVTKSYWTSRGVVHDVSLGGSAWPALGWIVVAAWTAVLVVLARAYRRDTQRV